MQTGVLVKWFTEKGYGFVQPDGGGPEYFTHIRQLSNAAEATPANGARISFLAEMDQNQGKVKTQQWTILSSPVAGPPAGGAPAGGVSSSYGPQPPQHPPSAAYGTQASAGNADGYANSVPQGTPQSQGTLKKWFPEKGFGFIAPDDGGDTFFAHVRQLTNGTEASVVEGTRVAYKAEWDAKQSKMKASTWSLLTGGCAGGVPPPPGAPPPAPPVPQLAQEAWGPQPQHQQQMAIADVGAPPPAPPAPQVTQEVGVPQQLVGDIVGPGASGLEDIKRRAGGEIHIEFAAISDGEMQVAKVVGPEVEAGIGVLLMLKKISDLV